MIGPLLRPASFRSALLLLGAATALPAALPAQAEAAGRAFLRAVEQEDWGGAARLLDLRAFKPLLDRSIELAREEARRPPPGVEDLLRMDPDMPRAMAEYQARRIREEREAMGGSPIAFRFAGVVSVEALGALSTEEAAAAWLQAQDSRWQVRELLRRNGCPAPARDSLARSVAFGVLGALAPNDSTAFLLYRNDRAGGPAPGVFRPAPSVLELARREGRWLVVPRVELLPGLDGPPEACDDRPPARRARPDPA